MLFHNHWFLLQYFGACQMNFITVVFELLFKQSNVTAFLLTDYCAHCVCISVWTPLSCS